MAAEWILKQVQDDEVGGGRVVLNPAPVCRSATGRRPILAAPLYLVRVRVNLL